MLRGLLALTGWLMVGAGAAMVNVPLSLCTCGALLITVAVLPRGKA